MQEIYNCKMKNIIFITLIVLSVCEAEAQKCKSKNVPFSITNAFKQTHPTIQKTHWGKDEMNYQVTYVEHNAPVSITYDPLGKMIITETQISVEQLPVSVTQYVEKNYPQDIYEDVAKITDADNSIAYEVQIKNTALIFDAQGNFVQEMKIDEK